MRPRIHVPLSPEDHATIRRWKRRVVAFYSALLAGLVIIATIAADRHGKANDTAAVERLLGQVGSIERQKPLDSILDPVHFSGK